MSTSSWANNHGRTYTMKTLICISLIISANTAMNAVENPGLSIFTADNNNTLITLGSVNDRMEMLVTLNGDGKMINLLLVDKKPSDNKYKEQSLRDINIDGIYDIRFSRLKVDSSYDYEIMLDDKWVHVSELQENGKSAKNGNAEYVFSNEKFTIVKAIK